MACDARAPFLLAPKYNLDTFHHRTTTGQLEYKHACVQEICFCYCRAFISIGTMYNIAPIYIVLIYISDGSVYDNPMCWIVKPPKL